MTIHCNVINECLLLNKKSRKTEKIPSFLQAQVKKYPNFFTSSRGLSKTLQQFIIYSKGKSGVKIDLTRGDRI
jgi:hypothetical protein